MKSFSPIQRNRKIDPLFSAKRNKPVMKIVPTIPQVVPLKAASSADAAGRTLFNAFMQHAPYFTWIVDSDQRLVFANQSLLRHFGRDEKCYGKNIFRLLPLTIAAAFHEMHTAVLQKKEPHKTIFTSRMADGREAFYQVTVFPIQNADAMMVGGQALDVTDSLLARSEAKKIQQHLMQVSEAGVEAMWDWDMETGHIFCNQSLHQLMGTTVAETLNLDWCYSRIHPEDRASVEAIIHNALAQGQKSWEAEYRFLNAAGVYKTVLNKGCILFEKEQPVRMIGFLQDISALRQVQTELMEERLKQQKGIAEAIIHSQEEERTRIGHELHDNVNQILSTVQLFTNMLEPGNENFLEIRDKAKSYVHMAIEEIRKLSKDMVMPGLRQGSLLESIEGVVDDLSYAGSFKIVFENNASCDIESLSRNKKITMFRIVQEQIKNIIKHSRASNVRIAIQCTQEFVQLIIQDDGVGFDPKTTRRGLGLSSIDERIRLENGKVLLIAAKGNGCKLEVHIPFI